MALRTDVLAAVLADPMLPLPFEIKRVRRDTSDTFTLELTPKNGGQLAPAAPGQFNMLYVFGIGEVPISISSAPGRPLLHTTRAVGTVTRAMARLKRGDAIGVRGPFGSRWPLDETHGKDVVLVAGGIGMAPLRGALLELMRRRKQYGRVVLIYGADEVFVLPRGSGGRLDWRHAINAKAGVSYRITKDNVVQFTADIFNMFNFQAVTSVDETLTFSDVLPFVTTSDNPQEAACLSGNQLPHCQQTTPDGVGILPIQTPDGAFLTSADLNPNYKKPTGYQAPISVRFGLRFTF